MGSEEEYHKVSDYDVKGSLRNHRIFVSRLYQAPWKAFTGALVFAAAGVFSALLTVGKSASWDMLMLSGLSLVVAGWFLFIGLTASSKQR